MSSLFAPPAVTISFPGSKNRVYYPGDVVGGVVHLRVDRNGKGKTSMDRVEVQLKGTIRTTFAFRPSSAAATGVKKTARETKRLAKSSSSGHNEMEIYQDGPTEIYSAEQTVWRSTSHPPIGPASASINLPFAFALEPSSFDKLPPSFKGGSRESVSVDTPADEDLPPASFDPWAKGSRGSTSGKDVAEVEYSIYVTGHKAGTFSFNERLQLPFAFSPTPTIDLSLVPPPLSENDHHPDHPPHLPPPAPSHWITTIAEHTVRDGWLPWSKKGSLTVRLSLPPLPLGLPTSHPLPFHLHLTSTPSDPAYPSPLITVHLILNRTVLTVARGNGQFVPQRGLKPFLTLDLSEQEKGMLGAREIVVGGVMEIPKEEGVSFGKERTGGVLGCEHHISLHIPIKGLGNDLRVERFLSHDIGMGFEPSERAALEEKRRVEAAAAAGLRNGAGGYEDDGENREIMREKS